MRCRAELPLGFLPVRLLFAHREQLCELKQHTRGWGTCFPTAPVLQRVSLLSAGEQLWLRAVVTHTAWSWALSVRRVLQYCWIKAGEADPPLPHHSTNSWLWTAQRQFPGIFQKMVHSKGCFPNSKMDNVASAIIFFLTVYPKTPPESLEPSGIPSIPHATSTSYLLLEAHQSAWGNRTCAISDYLIWTHTQNDNYDPGFTQAETNLGDGMISTQHFPEFCGNSMCFMCSWNLLSLCFKRATKKKFPAFWNLQQRENHSPGVICDLLLHSQGLWSWVLLPGKLVGWEPADLMGHGRHSL